MTTGTVAEEGESRRVGNEVLQVLAVRGDLDCSSVLGSSDGSFREHLGELHVGVGEL